jgi:DNA sulfur modification protein DndE
MTMHSLEHIRLSQQAKDHLTRLKAKTGIKNWNVLCRWAFCISLAEPSAPTQINLFTDSNVEMTWRVFGGQYHAIYYALLKERCKQDGFAITDATLIEQFRLHLHRGIGYLFADKSITDISSLISKIPLVNN